MITRRNFLGGLAIGGLSTAVPAWASARNNTVHTNASNYFDDAQVNVKTGKPLYLGDTRAITVRNLRFNESATFLLGRNESVSFEAQRELSHLLRDHHNGKVGQMDPALIVHLMDLQSLLGTGDTAFEIVSAYRSPQTNQMLRKRSKKVATHSLHMRGRAIDIRLPGVSMKELHYAALDLGAGGVGFYNRFVH
ncbi:MAG: DUF882 domain-containing protein, partial [Burkholderiaceae bacterium]